MGLPLEPMTDDEARTLLASALAVDTSVGGEELLQITREAGGNPFLLRQLAGYLTADPTRRHRVTFAEMLDERVRALPREGQRFLETLAICGRPMPPELVCDACGVTRERQSLVAMLRSSPLHSQQRLVGTGRDLPRSDPRSARRAACPQSPCARSTGSWRRHLSRTGATTAKRCSNTIGAPETTTTRRCRRGLPRRRLKAHSRSIAPRGSTGRRWRCGLTHRQPPGGGKESPARWRTPANRPRLPNHTCALPLMPFVLIGSNSSSAPPSSSSSPETSTVVST